MENTISFNTKFGWISATETNNKITKIYTLNNLQKEKLIKGFAIGRTIFSEAAKKWLNNEISNDYAKDIMSNKLKKLIKIWENSRN